MQTAHLERWAVQLAPSARLERANLLVRNQTLYPLSYEGPQFTVTDYTTNLPFFQVAKKQTFGVLTKPG